MYKDKLEVFELPEVTVHAIPQCTTDGIFRAEMKKVKLNPAKKNILMLHAGVTGMKEFAHGESNELLVDYNWLDETKFDYVALGHYHVFSKVGHNAWFSGSTERISFNEVGQAKGFLVVDLSKSTKVDMVRVRTRDMVEMAPIDATGKDSVVLLEEILSAIAKEKPADKIIRLSIRNIPQHVMNTLDTKKIREAAIEAVHFEPKYEKLNEEGVLEELKITKGGVKEEFMSFINASKIDMKEDREYFFSLWSQEYDKIMKEEEESQTVRIKSLTLKNYRQYKDSCVEFGDGITGVVGLNGAGKSTLIEAIAWTLYGPNAARTGKEGIKRSTAPVGANVETELVIEIGGTEYKVVRVLKGSSQSADASMLSGGKVIADSVKGVEKEVAYLLGMDWKSFYTSFFARQKELNALTELTPASRRDVIIRMLRIDAVDKVVDSVKKQLKEKKLELELLNKKVVLRKPTEILAEKLAIEKNKKETEKELKIVESEITKIEVRTFQGSRSGSMRKGPFTTNSSPSTKSAPHLTPGLRDLSKRESELNEELSQVKKLEKESATLEKAL